MITDREMLGDIRGSVRSLTIDNIAAGLDPERATIFTHSAVPALNQLMLPFLSLVSVAELQRNPTVKDEAKSAGITSIGGLLLTYPVHQAADILFCKANVVPVGRDQLPHLEQTRVVARRFNERYGATFPEPDALLSEATLILGLDGTKMSKSKGNVIELRMTADETAKMLKGAKTDSDRVITYDPETRPEVANLLLLISLCEGVRARADRRRDRRRWRRRPEEAADRRDQHRARAVARPTHRARARRDVRRRHPACRQRARQRGGRGHPRRGPRADGHGLHLTVLHLWRMRVTHQ